MLDDDACDDAVEEGDAESDVRYDGDGDELPTFHVRDWRDVYQQHLDDACLIDSRCQSYIETYFLRHNELI